MTWIDISAIVILVIFMGVGARLGSLWLGACLIGGFAGAYISDIYALPFSQMLPSVASTPNMARIFLYFASLVIVLVLGYLLSRLSSALFLGIFDSAIGLVVGAFVGSVAIFLTILFIFPTMPQVEKNKAWKNSSLVRPLYERLPI